MELERGVDVANRGRKETRAGRRVDKLRTTVDLFHKMEKTDWRIFPTQSEDGGRLRLMSIHGSGESQFRNMTIFRKHKELMFSKNVPEDVLCV